MPKPHSPQQPTHGSVSGFEGAEPVLPSPSSGVEGSGPPGTMGSMPRAYSPKPSKLLRSDSASEASLVELLLQLLSPSSLAAGRRGVGAGLAPAPARPMPRL